MRIPAAPEQTNERKIIQTLLMVCLGLGFISVVAVYLPHHLQNAGQSARTATPSITRLSEIIPQAGEAQARPAARAPEITEKGPVFRFTPEAEPPPPPGLQQAMPQVIAPAQPERISAAEPPSLTSNLSETVMSPLEAEKPRNHRHAMSSLVDGSAQRSAETGARWWETPRGLEVDVNFWKDIYTKHTSSHVVLHDPKHLQIVYEVVDLTDIDRNTPLTATQQQTMRKERVSAARAKYEAALKQLSTNPDAAMHTKLGRQIANLFATVDELHKYTRAYERGIRSQTGQRDKFIAALKTSGAYLGEIELIFKSYGLPRELTRLVFVESMFQLNAYSKVGAAGIWQFMPDTGKHYLRINRFIDERLDPLVATHAAAKLLKRNYDELGTWPLALNAYNAGRGRLQQAVTRMGTTDIAAIIKGFEHPGYGFASRNFFLEFVAAREVADNAAHYFGAIDYDDPLNYDVIDLPFHVSLAETAKLTSIPLEKLIELNPGYLPRVTSGSHLVPMGSTLRVPSGEGERFLQVASRGMQTHSGLLEHQVASGETIGQIAGMYGVSPERIQEANPSLKRKPQRGQRLYIPFD